MGKKSYQHMETAVIHEGYDSKQMLGSLTPPIFQTSTYTFESAEQGEARFAAEEDGYIYTRLGSPTVRILEEKIAALEGGERGLAFSSGMAAVSTILFALTKANDHIVCSSGLYGCTYGLLSMMDQKYNIKTNYSNMSTKEELESQIKKETALIYVETPINPTMRVIDLELIVAIAKKHRIPVVVDNTFSSPYLQRPIEIGCDFVIHSATKYIGGHGDVIGGLAVGKKEIMDEIALTTQKDIGGVLSPFDAWLLIRGLKTLPIRMDRHSSNAEKIVEKMKGHPNIKKVYYPGDPDFPEAQVVKKQMKHGGGVISFEVNGGKQGAQFVLNQLQFIKIAVSLGDAESLMEHPGSMTHATIPEEERLRMGIKESLLRLSVGIEAWEDIWNDIEQALDAL